MKKHLWVAFAAVMATGIAGCTLDDTYASCFVTADCNDVDDRCFGVDIPAAGTSGDFCTRECASDAACESNFGFPGACYGLGTSVPICFQTCDFDSDCYSSSVCIEVLTDTGFLDYICVPDN
jgi:hypothetical protein